MKLEKLQANLIASILIVIFYFLYHFTLQLCPFLIFLYAILGGILVGFFASGEDYVIIGLIFLASSFIGISLAFYFAGFHSYFPGWGAGLNNSLILSISFLTTGYLTDPYRKGKQEEEILDGLVCPNCGKSNPPDIAKCNNCNLSIWFIC